MQQLVIAEVAKGYVLQVCFEHFTEMNYLHVIILVDYKRYYNECGVFASTFILFKSII